MTIFFKTLHANKVDFRLEHCVAYPGKTYIRFYKFSEKLNDMYCAQYILDDPDDLIVDVEEYLIYWLNKFLDGYREDTCEEVIKLKNYTGR